MLVRPVSTAPRGRPAARRTPSASSRSAAEPVTSTTTGQPRHGMDRHRTRDCSSCGGSRQPEVRGVCGHIQRPHQAAPPRDLVLLDVPLAAHPSPTCATAERDQSPRARPEQPVALGSPAPGPSLLLRLGARTPWWSTTRCGDGGGRDRPAADALLPEVAALDVLRMKMHQLNDAIDIQYDEPGPVRRTRRQRLTSVKTCCPGRSPRAVVCQRLLRVARALACSMASTNSSLPILERPLMSSFFATS